LQRDPAEHGPCDELHGGEVMNPGLRRALQLVSMIGLALSAIPAFLVFGGLLDKSTYLRLMALGMLLWFGSAIFWVRRDGHTE
jgi:hypothetical protein